MAWAADDYFDLPLQDLLSMEVTSVSKALQRLREVGAAVQVISAQEIRSSGAQNIPDLLRQVPGLQVAQIDAHLWAISSRGFNGLRANKLLVLLDGRSVYTPLYGGVFWDAQDTLIEDIERIEVIRGPGGSIWGANAVNGVINIITRKSSQTQGTIVSVGAGDELRSLVSARHGGTIDDDTHYRVYAKFREDDNSIYVDGREAHDGGDFAQAGFRVDHEPIGDDRWTVQGDLYNGKSRNSISLFSTEPPYLSVVNDAQIFKGANLLGRWQHDLPDGGSTSLQVYWDWTERSSLLISDKRHLLDLEWQHQLAPMGRHSLIWGAGYRYISDQIRDSFVLTVDGSSREDHLFSGYVQDTISFEPDLNLILGSKIEHNDYSGWEIQPTARLVWNPSNEQTYWAAVSRAVHTPTRFEHDGGIHYVEYAEPVPTVVYWGGDKTLGSESLIAYEAGWRAQLNERLSVDTAVFYNDYQDLLGLKPGAVSCQPSGAFPPCLDPDDDYMLVQRLFANNLRGSSHGLEISFQWQANDWLKLRGNYSYLKMDLKSSIGSVDDEVQVGWSPRHQAGITADMAVNANTDLHVGFRYVDELETLNVSSYLDMDLHLRWRVDENLEFDLSGRNLLHDSHAEFVTQDIAIPSASVERSVFGQLRWNY